MNVFLQVLGGGLLALAVFLGGFALKDYGASRAAYKDVPEAAMFGLAYVRQREAGALASAATTKALTALGLIVGGGLLLGVSGLVAPPKPAIVEGPVAAPERKSL